MKKLCLIAGCLLQLALWPIHAQDFGFLRISYGDRAYYPDQLPTLFNPDLIQGDYRLTSVYTESLVTDRTRLREWAWDMLHWSSPVKMKIGFYWILIDPVSYPPEKEYEFSQNGQILHYSGNDYIANQEFNSQGQLVFASYHNLRDSADFTFTLHEIDYHDNSQINKEIRKYCRDEDCQDPLRRDSIQYLYNENNLITGIRKYSQFLSDPFILLERDTLLYSPDKTLLEEMRLTLPENGIFQHKQRIQYDSHGRIAAENYEEMSDSLWIATSRKQYTWSEDGLTLIVDGQTLQDLVWVDNYQYREVKNQNGQPLVVEEFYIDKQGNFFNTETGYEVYLTKRTYGELKGRNCWTYDERGLVSSFSHYSFKMQADSLPDFRKEFHWQAVSSVPDPIRIISEIHVYPNPCNNQVFLELKDILPDPIAVAVYDHSGKLVMDYNTRYNTGTLMIPVADLMPGSYFIRLTAGDKTLSTRFIKY